MKMFLSSVLCLAGCVIFAGSLFAQADGGSLAYPKPKTVDQVDDYHGTKIADPYRWLEDADSAETAAWVAAENKVTQAYLAGLPSRARYKERLTALYNYERYSRFEKAGARYLFLRNDGLQNQDVLYVADALTGKERVLLDPNKLRADGTAALTGHLPSNDGKLLAYGVADAGSDWAIWHVRNIETGQDLSDEVRWSKFVPVAWAPDNRAFYYLRFPEPKPGEALRAANEFAKIYLHKLGEPQSQDKLIYERPDHKDWLFLPVVTDDGRYLQIVVETGDASKNLLFYQDLQSGVPHGGADFGMEGAVRAAGQSRQRVLRPDHRRSAARAHRGDRCGQAGAGQLARNRAAAERAARVSPDAERPDCRLVDEGCGQPRADLRTGWEARAGCRAARRRQRGTLSGTAERPGDVLRVHQLHLAAGHVPAG